MVQAGFLVNECKPASKNTGDQRNLLNQRKSAVLTIEAINDN
jgi:hypothetical protein